jgi:hypothetical protein
LERDRDLSAGENISWLMEKEVEEGVLEPKASCRVSGMLEGGSYFR